MTPKITALAITLNEEENVKRFVQSLSFADEIIFIDSYSTDATVALAKELGVTVIQRQFDDFSTQRNFALQQAKNDWIVFFDLDEYISPELGKEIIDVTSNPNDCIAFFVKRNFFFMEKLIKHGGWKNNKTIRVFNKIQCNYNGNLVDESITTVGNISVLKNYADHYSYKNFDNYNNKLNLHSQLQAKSLYLKNKRPNLYHFFILPYFQFWWQYACRLGFLDAKEGFILAYLNSFAVFKKYLQLWMMYRKIE